MVSRTFALGLLFLLLPATAAAAQPSPQWGQMQPGPYDGFMTIERRFALFPESDRARERLAETVDAANAD